MRSGGIEFQGVSGDANTTLLNVTNPTTARTITLPDASGTVGLLGSTQTWSGSNFFSSPVSVNGTTGLVLTPGDGSGNSIKMTNPTGDELKISNSTTDIARLSDGGSFLTAAYVQAGNVNPDAPNVVKLKSGGVEFEGSTGDANKTTLEVTNPTATRTITFGNVTGNGAVIETKTDSGDYGSGNYEGRLVINTANGNFKVFAEGSWRTLANW